MLIVPIFFLDSHADGKALMARQLAVAFETSAGVLQGLFGVEVGEELEIEIR